MIYETFSVCIHISSNNLTNYAEGPVGVLRGAPREPRETYIHLQSVYNAAFACALVRTIEQFNLLLFTEPIHPTTSWLTTTAVRIKIGGADRLRHAQVARVRVNHMHQRRIRAIHSLSRTLGREQQCRGIQSCGLKVLS